ncbi:MAG: GNAT family N-acetyltransferase [Chitinophagaceae bacterium]
MDEIEFLPNDKGAFVINVNGKRIAEMIVGISGKEMSVYHTEVVDKLKGQGIGSKLIDAMADHARKNKLRGTPRCPFVKAKFKEMPDQYSDIYNEP